MYRTSIPICYLSSILNTSFHEKLGHKIWKMTSSEASYVKINRNYSEREATLRPSISPCHYNINICNRSNTILVSLGSFFSFFLQKVRLRSASLANYQEYSHAKYSNKNKNYIRLLIDPICFHEYFPFYNYLMFCA